jgi:hypothetical protein
MIKEKEQKIKVLVHELLTFTLFYLILTPCDIPILQIKLFSHIPPTSRRDQSMHYRELRLRNRDTMTMVGGLATLCAP